MKVNRFYFFSICLLSILLFRALPVSAGAFSLTIDIKPTSCPNALNCKAGGFIPVAISGDGTTFDVADIDVSTIRLEGVAPERSQIEDVATEFTPSAFDCDSCTEASGDGINDLVLKFNKQAVFAAIGSVSDGECLRLRLVGNFNDGENFEGFDNVLIKCKNP